VSILDWLVPGRKKKREDEERVRRIEDARKRALDLAALRTTYPTRQKAVLPLPESLGDATKRMALLQAERERQRLEAEEERLRRKRASDAAPFMGYSSYYDGRPTSWVAPVAESVSAPITQDEPRFSSGGGGNYGGGGASSSYGESSSCSSSISSDSSCSSSGSSD
jgi:hypothetical protein